jgi:hypothetical protein
MSGKPERLALGWAGWSIWAWWLKSSKRVERAAILVDEDDEAFLSDGSEGAAGAVVCAGWLAFSGLGCTFIRVLCHGFGKGVSLAKLGTAALPKKFSFFYGKTGFARRAEED